MSSKVLFVGPEEHGPPRAPDKAWRVAGWFGLLLAVVGLVEILFVWFDPALSSGREYQRIGASLARLPLPSLGVGLCVASALARGHRKILVTAGIAALLLAVASLAAYILFLNAVPAVLSGIAVAAQPEVKRVVLRTTVIAVGSSVAYLAAGVFALRHLRRPAAG